MAYKTDKQRQKEGRSTYYTAPELDAACAEYFVDCDSQEPPKRPTLPGLLLYLGVTDKEWRTWRRENPDIQDIRASAKRRCLKSGTGWSRGQTQQQYSFSSKRHMEATPTARSLTAPEE